MKPSIPSGTRDFGPAEMYRRNRFFDVVREVFSRYGYQPLETPAFEYLATLTGKYGDEGDKLIFKILNSGDFLADAGAEALANRDHKKLLPQICDKALRYDLTVPFARYVVMQQHQLTFPFKRWQIQPVWRADRPQKGRYREFVQCDVDVIGSKSLLYELELLQILSEVFQQLDVGIVIKLNHRKLLAGIAELVGSADKLIDLTVAIDKLDKIGLEKVEAELKEKGFDDAALLRVREVLRLTGDNDQKLAALGRVLAGTASGPTGVAEMAEVLALAQRSGSRLCPIEFDLSLARGLSYYTGAIFEVKVQDPRSTFTSSISGGGRYDDLTGIFGLPDMSGVGVSFGADRICDVLAEIAGAGAETKTATRVLVVNFGAAELDYALRIVRTVRQAGVAADLYPEAAKLKKQFGYADALGIPYVAIAGGDEIAAGQVTVKNLKTGEQQKVALADVAATVR
ncbi:MAG: histidine--tRNA ligase [Planctomycetes bacterium]|nr:histidine--tRNA ligase [Planctomycetota bacterium]